MALVALGREQVEDDLGESLGVDAHVTKLHNRPQRVAVESGA
jgi:hypothetical protein